MLLLGELLQHMCRSNNYGCIKDVGLTIHEADIGYQKSSWGTVDRDKA
jgi:hypothetical protein